MWIRERWTSVQPQTTIQRMSVSAENIEFCQENKPFNTENKCNSFSHPQNNVFGRETIKSRRMSEFHETHTQLNKLRIQISLRYMCVFSVNGHWSTPYRRFESSAQSDYNHSATNGSKVRYCAHMGYHQKC